MTSPALEIPCAWTGLTFMAVAGQKVATALASLGEALPGRLLVVERVLGQLAPAPCDWLSRFIALVTGTLDRDRLLSHYMAYCRSLADAPLQQRKALRALRAAFERYQDICSADDYLEVKQAYPEIDAALAPLSVGRGDSD